LAPAAGGGGSPCAGAAASMVRGLPTVWRRGRLAARERECVES
jgi:hypothetical protein